MPGITATIITFNEETRIAETIASLACCDEIIVVDSHSVDRTREIARALGARVIERDWPGYARQKNFAADQAVNDWILSVDADERPSIELADEITRWKRSVGAVYDRPGAPRSASATARSLNNRAPLQFVAFAMPRRAFYLGRWIKHSGWYPDWKIRLYNRRYCQWEGDFVHEWVNANGEVDRIRGDLLHFPYRDWKDHNSRIEKYTALAAKAAQSNGRHGSVLKLVFAPPLTFLKTFFIRAGFLDGWRGFAIAYMGARYVFQREFRILR